MNTPYYPPMDEKFKANYRRMFGAEPTQSDWEYYEDMPGASRYAFDNNLSLGKVICRMAFSAVFVVIIVVVITILFH